MLDIYNIELDKLYGSTELSPHMEDYMEAILKIGKSSKVVRVKDIAAELNIKMPSVTSALNKLKEMDLIEYEKYGYIELTPAGERVARQVASRHICVKEFFYNILQINEEDAEEQACKIEHHIGSETCKQLHKFLIFYKSELAADKTWAQELQKILNPK